MLILVVLIACAAWLATWTLWLVHKSEPIEIDAKDTDGQG